MITRRASASIIMSVQYAQPTTGQSVTMDNVSTLLVDPAGTLATLTIVLPTAPADKQRAKIGSSQIITVLTVTGTIVGTLTTLALGGYAEFIWYSAASKWFRVG